ncbi:MAG: EF-P lysine aminoacylase EpmA [Alphaproteobacteria bacterium]
MWWHPHIFEARKATLEARGRILRSVRGFFDKNGFLEVETPILQACPVMDVHIHGFKTEFLTADLRHERDFYLHTSPEFAMKKLLVAGMPKIYQLCHVFRNGESGRLHSPEFTMLEWYRAGSGYREAMEDCIGLVRAAAQELKVKTLKSGEKLADPFLKWNIISVVEAFDRYAGIDLAKYCHVERSETSHEILRCAQDDIGGFERAISSLGIRTAKDDRWDDLFFRVMAEKIEPHLGVGVPAILYDYPVSMASLARRKPEDPRFAERFEVYVCGVELANGFGELTDAAEQRKRFQEEMDLKEKIYGYRYPPDEDFFKALEYGMPESSGVALGFDRLVMLATGAADIEQVLWAGKP